MLRGKGLDDGLGVEGKVFDLQVFNASYATGGHWNLGPKTVPEFERATWPGEEKFVILAVIRHVRRCVSISEFREAVDGLLAQE